MRAAGRDPGGAYGAPIDTGRWATSFVGAVDRGLRARAEAARAGPMAAYMRDQFAFLGVAAPGQKAAVREALAEAGRPVDHAEVVAAVDTLWARPEREYRYCGCDLVRGFAPRARAELVKDLGRWIRTDPWWDTCDTLARRGVGTIVRRHPDQRPTMDVWLAGEDLWLTRAALLHMGNWREAIDRDWVFAACLARAGHTDFFVRKAIGWILRDLAWVDAEAVRAFVAAHEAELSPLSRREALKNVRPTGGR